MGQRESERGDHFNRASVTHLGSGPEHFLAYFVSYELHHVNRQEFFFCVCVFRLQGVCLWHSPLGCIVAQLFFCYSFLFNLFI